MKIHIPAVTKVGKCALDGFAADDAHILALLCHLALIVYQQQGAAIVGRRGAGAVADLDGALTGNVVFE